MNTNEGNFSQTRSFIFGYRLILFFIGLSSLYIAVSRKFLPLKQFFR